MNSDECFRKPDHSEGYEIQEVLVRPASWTESVLGEVVAKVSALLRTVVLSLSLVGGKPNLVNDAFCVAEDFFYVIVIVHYEVFLSHVTKQSG